MKTPQTRREAIKRDILNAESLKISVIDVARFHETSQRYVRECARELKQSGYKVLTTFLLLILICNVGFAQIEDIKGLYEVKKIALHDSKEPVQFLSQYNFVDARNAFVTLADTIYVTSESYHIPFYLLDCIKVETDSTPVAEYDVYELSLIDTDSVMLTGIYYLIKDNKTPSVLELFYPKSGDIPDMLYVYQLIPSK